MTRTRGNRSSLRDRKIISVKSFRLRPVTGLRTLLIAPLAFVPRISAQATPLPGPNVQEIYQRLLPQIERIPAFDHHAHPGFFDDADVDAMASPPNPTEALRTRADNPELVSAAKDLFGYPYADFSPEHAKWLVAKKAELKKQHAGAAYFDWILDKINTESSVANRAMMADYLDPARFPWVFFADAFMWPLNNERETARNPDEGVYIPLQEKMLHRWMQQEGVKKLPPNFSDYLEFIVRTVDENRKRGAIAMKFEVAYFRPTTFSDPPRNQAQEIYEKYVSGAAASEQEYRTFQDFIFRFLVALGGRLAVPVHIHTAVGIGDYFNLSQSNVMNLENVLRDPRYHSTTFVLIHGGYPLEREAIWLASAKNVYLDSSFGELVQYPSAFKNTLKMWLEAFPEKITFGTDCFPYNEVLGSEESYWLGAKSSRMALAAALAEMISENEITENRALAMAHAYLHDTAVSLYGGRVH